MAIEYDQCIELHDSELLSVIQSATDVSVALDAYVHRAPLRKGGRGTGWTQRVTLILVKGVVEESIANLPCSLAEGEISGFAIYRNLIPLPCEIQGELRFEVVNFLGERLSVRATHLRLASIGEASYVEETPATFYQV